MTKKLIITADDYGMSPLFNQGILELAKKKIITSLSVMIKRNNIKIKELKTLETISIGLHLEIKDQDTQGKIENQIKKFQKKFGYLPSHLDGHQHKHLTFHNLPKVLKLAKKYNLSIRSYQKEDRKIIKKAGIKTPNNFISWHPDRTEKLWKKLANNKSAITELVCHPGYYDKKCTYPYNLSREKELTTLKSKEFEKYLKKFQLINYTQL